MINGLSIKNWKRNVLKLNAICKTSAGIAANDDEVKVRVNPSAMMIHNNNEGNPCIMSVNTPLGSLRMEIEFLDKFYDEL